MKHQVFMLVVMVSCGRIEPTGNDDASVDSYASDAKVDDSKAVSATCAVGIDGGTVTCPSDNPVCLTIVDHANVDGGVQNVQWYECIDVSECEGTLDCSCYAANQKPKSCNQFGGTVTCTIDHGAVRLSCPGG